MIKYVLDSSSLIRYIDNEAGADRLEAILGECVSGEAAVLISAIQWGEVAGNLRKRMGASHEKRILSGLLPVEAEIVPADAECAMRAGDLRVDRRISYADAFALELAMRSSRSHPGDRHYGFKAVDDLARIEFLPVKYATKSKQNQRRAAGPELLDVGVGHAGDVVGDGAGAGPGWGSAPGGRRGSRLGSAMSAAKRLLNDLRGVGVELLPCRASCRGWRRGSAWRGAHRLPSAG